MHPANDGGSGVGTFELRMTGPPMLFWGTSEGLARASHPPYDSMCSRCAARGRTPSRTPKLWPVCARVGGLGGSSAQARGAPPPGPLGPAHGASALEGSARVLPLLEESVPVHPPVER